MRLGVVERHYLLCPFCGHRQDLVERRCIGCGAKPVAVVWEAGSPELALVGRRPDNGSARVYEKSTGEYLGNA